MKEFTLIYPTLSPIKLLDENGTLVGEILLNIIAGFNEKIKIDNEIFNIKYNGLFSRDYKIFDQNENLVFKSDISKNRLLYFGDGKEIFTYKTYGWFKNRLNLCRNDTLIISVTSKGFFRKKYKIEVNSSFSNHLVTLAFLNDYISSQG